LNQQPVEKRVRSTQLDVHSIFATIQGEGPFCGTPAVFIRLAGCNLQCPSCDTDYTSTRKKSSADEIVIAIRALSLVGLVVITGGEPFRQEITTLLQKLCDAGYYVQIETNGTLSPDINSLHLFNTMIDQRTGVYVVCSPKTGKVHTNITKIACCYKYVGGTSSLTDSLDGLPDEALHHPAKPRVARPPAGWNRPIYLQPIDEKNHEINQKNIKACVTSCMKHGYILQLQIHKILELP
jgi:7-carboxy-7-deazaguanine synthase